MSRTLATFETTTVAVLLLVVSAGCDKTREQAGSGPVAIPVTGPPPPAPELNDVKLIPIAADGPHRFPLRRVVGDTARYAVERYTTVEGIDRITHYYLKVQLQISVVGVKSNGDMTQVWIVSGFEADPNIPPDVVRIRKLEADNYRIELLIPADSPVELLLNDKYVYSRFQDYLHAVNESSRPRYPSNDPNEVEARRLQILEDLKEPRKLLDFAVPEATWLFDANAIELPPHGRWVGKFEQPFDLGGRSGFVNLKAVNEWSVMGVEANRSCVTIRMKSKMDADHVRAVLIGKLPDEERVVLATMFAVANTEAVYQLATQSGWPVFAERTSIRLEHGNTVTRLTRLRRITE